MQISGNPLLAGLGRPQQTQSASSPRIAPQRQAKATSAAPLQGRAPDGAPRTSGQAVGPRPAQAPAAAQAAGLAGARNLEQAVQALAEQGRLPPRGSLIDLSA